MQVREFVESAIALTQNSPVRGSLTQKSGLPIQMNQLDQLPKLIQQLELYRAKLNRPLTVVLMGEVKAGKSTLMNSLAGGEVAPTDVLEATAVITQVQHGEPKGIITLTNGQEITGKPEEIYAKLQAQQTDATFAAQVEFVKIQLPLQGLVHLVIVDTPGIATMTESNAKRTSSFAQEADVVLWVFNSNHLGQIDVAEELANVARLGKPIVGVLNRIDEVESSPERLVRYLRRELGLYLQEIFPLSARSAWDGLLTRNEEKQKESGFTAITHFLVDVIQADRDRVQLQSILSSASASLRLDATLHDSFYRSVTFAQEQTSYHLKEVQHQQQRVERVLVDSLRSSVRNEFLLDEEHELLREIDQIGIFQGKKARERMDFFRAHLENRASNAWNEVLQKLSQRFTAEWQVAIEGIQAKLKAKADSFDASEGARIAAAINSLPAGQQSLLMGAGQGAAVATTAAATLAFYSAVIGPAAAYVTMGSALATFVPPLALAGAAAGAVFQVVRMHKQKQDYRRDINAAFDKLRDDYSAYVDNTIVPWVKEQCDKQADNLQEVFAKEYFRGWTEQEVSDLLRRTKLYIVQAESLAASVAVDLLRG